MDGSYPRDKSHIWNTLPSEKLKLLDPTMYMYNVPAIALRQHRQNISMYIFVFNILTIIDIYIII